MTALLLPTIWTTLPHVVTSLLVQVIAVVKNLTKTGITICATIHNPTPYCFNLFDRLMILLHGRVVYSGENGDLSGYSRKLSSVMCSFAVCTPRQMLRLQGRIL